MLLRFFNPNEVYVLKKLKSAFGEVSAEVTTGVLFTKNEVEVFKCLRGGGAKNTSAIATEVGIANITAKKALDGLQEKGQIDTEVKGKQIMWWIKS